MHGNNRTRAAWMRSAGLFVLCLICVAATGYLLGSILLGPGSSGKTVRDPGDAALADRFDMRVNHVVSGALEGVLTVEKTYWLRDEETVAPEPNPDNFGQTDDPSTLGWLLEDAEKLLDGQTMIFGTDTKITKGSQVAYYLDETILAVTWQHNVGDAIYTCSEVKIAHPSQFRRFLSDGAFGSGTLYTTTEMAASVNAVTASNGDYYAYRNFGNLVYNGEVKRADNSYLDTCYVDENGDLIMVDYFQIYKRRDVEQFVAENRIRFSLAFGPILIRDGRLVVKVHYPVGEVEEYYSRSALCQVGPLHYLLVAVNRRGQMIQPFAQHLLDMGVQQAYSLDGGQTSTIVTGDELINTVDYGKERKISDIIYFATAVPDGG